MEDAKPIEGFPGYVINKDGTVYTVNSGIRRRPSRTREGSMKITLYREGRAYTKSLALLVANAWVYNDFDPEIFDTPIHLDNDPANNHADNLAWRPRWFAVKYQRQYWNTEYRYATVQMQNTRTGEVYDRPMEICQRYGYLYIDVLRSCTRGDEVFPTWRQFRFID